MKHLSLISLFVLFNTGIAHSQPDPVTWSISEGYLIISGSGDMIDYDFVIETPPWYPLKDGIIGVIIEEGITSIGEWAFRECGEITSVSIANTVKTIGAHAFNFCQKLNSVDIPNSVISIGNGAFSFCDALSSVKIPSSVVSIGSTAFTSTNLDTITIPSGVTSIGNMAFYSCSYLASVTIPASVSFIGNMAFGLCDRLTEFVNYRLSPQELDNAFAYVDLSLYTPWGWRKLYVPSASVDLYSVADEWENFGIIESINDLSPRGNIGVLTWEFHDETLSISGNGVIPNYSMLEFPPWHDLKNIIKNVVIVEGVTEIGNYAFWQCLELTDVSIPQSLVTIGEGAFLEAGLKSLTVNGATLTNIGSHSFSYCSDLTSVSMPDVSVKHIGNSAFSYCQSLISIEIPASVETIGMDAFAHCSSLTSVSFPASLTQIGSYAFANCQKLQSINIPERVTHISHGAFFVNALISITVDEKNANYASSDGVLFNKNLTNLLVFPGGKSGTYSIPEAVETIEESAFMFSVLTSVSIPTSVTTINNYAFADCSHLAEIINFNPDPRNIPSGVFLGVNTSTCILRVPEPSILLYRNTLVWMNFENIVSLEAGFTLSHDSICLLTGKTALLTVMLPDEAIGDNVVNWSSDNPHVVTVTSDGTVTANNIGSAIITATIGSEQAICLVTVLEPGKTTIEGTVSNPTPANIRVNLYIKVDDSSDTKKGIVGGYILLATTIPNSDGKYSFENLPEGSYQIEVEVDDLDKEASDEIDVSGEETNVVFNISVDGDDIVFHGITTGAEDIFDARLHIYPNPFTDVIHITVETWRATSLQIVNAAGAIVHAQKITNSDETIYLGHLPTGMYFVRLENGVMLKTIKLIKVQ